MKDRNRNALVIRIRIPSYRMTRMTLLSPDYIGLLHTHKFSSPPKSARVDGTCVGCVLRKEEIKARNRLLCSSRRERGVMQSRTDQGGVTQTTHTGFCNYRYDRPYAYPSFFYILDRFLFVKNKKRKKKEKWMLDTESEVKMGEI